MVNGKLVLPSVDWHCGLSLAVRCRHQVVLMDHPGSIMQIPGIRIEESYPPILPPIAGIWGSTEVDFR
jgi:hypothetical protein